MSIRSPCEERRYPESRVRTSRYWSWARNDHRWNSPGRAASSRSVTSSRLASCRSSAAKSRCSAAAGCQRVWWANPGSAQASRPRPKNSLRHGPLGDRRSSEVGVEPFEEARPERRGRLATPEAADLALAEQVVACEHLVGAFSGEHHLDAGLPHQPRQQEERRRRGPQQGTLGVVHDLGEGVPRCPRDAP